MQKEDISMLKDEAVDQSSLSDLKVEVLEHIQTFMKNPETLRTKKSSKPLRLQILLKNKPLQTFLCDSENSIQAELRGPKSKPFEEYELSPFNQVKSHYYQPITRHDYAQISMNPKNKSLQKYFGRLDRSEEELNALKQYRERMGLSAFDNVNNALFEKELQFIEQLSPEQLTCPSPYEPLFYFPGNNGKTLIDFVKERKANQNKQKKLQVIEISQWSIEIVNIWGNGAFAILLKAYIYKKLPPSSTPTKLIDISSLIYEPQIIELMREMRTKQIRSELKKPSSDNTMVSESEENKNEIHFTYFLAMHRLKQKTSFKVIQSNIGGSSASDSNKKRIDDITLDKKGQVLKFDQHSKPLNFVPFGAQYRDLVLFPFPLNSKDFNTQENHIRQLDCLSRLRVHESFLFVQNQAELSREVDLMKIKKKLKRTYPNTGDYQRSLSKTRQQLNQSDGNLTTEYLEQKMAEDNCQKKLSNLMLHSSDEDLGWQDQDSRNEPNVEMQDQGLYNSQESLEAEVENRIKEQLRGSDKKGSLEIYQREDSEMEEDSDGSGESSEEENEYFKAYREQIRRNKQSFR